MRLQAPSLGWGLPGSHGIILFMGRRWSRGKLLLAVSLATTTACAPSESDLLASAQSDGARGKDVAVASDGSVFLAGNFQGHMSLGDCTADSSGDYDFFVARLSSEGDCLWLRSFGSVAWDSVEAISSFEDGLVAVGRFGAEFQVAGTTLTATGTDTWVAAFSGEGDPLWATAIGGAGEQAPYDVVAGHDGLYVAGAFEEEAAAGDVTLSPTLGRDGMLWRFDEGGTAEWAKAFGGPGDDGATELAVAGDEVLLSGHFWESVQIGDDQFSSHGLWDGFLAAIDPANGDGLWAWRLGGEMDDRGGAIASGPEGIVWSGTYGPSAMLGTVVLDSHGGTDSFVAAVSQAGIGDVATIGGGGEDAIGSIAMDEQGVVVAGTFSDALTLGDVTLVSAALADVFAARLSLDGEHLWSVRLGTASSSSPDTMGGSAIAASSLWMTGGFSGEMTTSGSDVAIAAEGDELFFARFHLP